MTPVWLRRLPSNSNTGISPISLRAELNSDFVSELKKSTSLGCQFIPHKLSINAAL